MSIITTFWEEVEKTPSSFNPEEPIVHLGVVVSPNATEFQRSIFLGCTSPEKFAQEFFATPPPPTVLDLGAGLGTNSLTMARNGSHVTAIDSSKELLTLFSESSKGVCPKENLRLCKGDIATMQSYQGPFDLVLAVDILPYLSPTSLQSTLKKIHECLSPDGIFVGTLFTLISKETPFHTFMGKIGAHFYKGDEKFVRDILTYSGFKIIALEKKRYGQFRFKATKT